MDNAGLVAAYVDGESWAFAELVRRYRERLLSFIDRIIGDHERAEDLVQEAFIRVHRHIHRFDRTRKFSTWVYTIASNLAKNELRNRSRSPLVLYQSLQPAWRDDERPLQFEDARCRPDDMFARRTLQEAIDRAVGRLSEQHRRVFILRELEGRSYEEIARITGCHLGTVKSRLNRARGSFGRMMAEDLR